MLIYFALDFPQMIHHQGKLREGKITRKASVSFLR